MRAGNTPKMIADRLHVHVSTVYMEISRNGRARSYDAERAIRECRRRRERLHRPRSFYADMKREFESLVRSKRWSPEQIRGYMARVGRKWVSVETMYDYLRRDRAAGGDLYTFTRHRLKKRRRDLYNYRAPIPGRVDISERPTGRGSETSRWT